MATGFANAGFSHAGIIEWNRDACNTLRHNFRCNIHEADVRTVNFKSFGKVSVVSGGPPCQPFSLGGKHHGFHDIRDMFPQAVRAVRELCPRAFIFENVKGLARMSFADYFGYLLLQLTYPSLALHSGEDWRAHRRKLEQHRTAGGIPEYNLVFQVLNAADFGVPQKRHRMFLVGFRADQEIEWTFPLQTRSERALHRSQCVTGEYWDRHRICKRVKNKVMEEIMPSKGRLFADGISPELPWLTVRDVIGDLPSPETSISNTPSSHFFIPGAKSYAGHTGSSLDCPAKTLKAGSHGVPGGENMFTDIDGLLRYFTIREAARLQTFPDTHSFHGSWTEIMRQLGNAVPVSLAEIVATSVAQALIAA